MKLMYGRNALHRFSNIAYEPAREQVHTPMSQVEGDVPQPAPSVTEGIQDRRDVEMRELQRVYVVTSSSKR